MTPRAERITIGRPIANTTLHILDGDRAIVPVGVVGELWIGGEGLARGYLGRDDLTEAAFQDVTLAGRAPVRLYRTGDIGRRLADGRIELLGRRDSQVKLRGFRIELGDVEAAIRSQPEIAQAAAAVRTGAHGSAQLVGYYMPAPGTEPQADALAAALARLVPNYMVPTAWVRLDAFPQTANGKLDRNKLPDPPLRAPAAAAGREITLPRTELEKALAEIWSEVLGVSPIGTTDNLFALGADSLNVFRIAARMSDRGIGLQARHLMQHPTIAELAALAEGAPANPLAPPSLKSFRGGQRRKQAVPA